MSEHREEEIPRLIGKYEILARIGEGGFGIVYKGRDPFIRRTVAVKTCTSSEERVRRHFFREAEIAGNLRHENVVTIHDFGVHEDTPYLVQEFLPGSDLETLLRDDQEDLSLVFRIRCLRGVAAGLAYAHDQGVIHRDVKPGNVRVLKDGRVKVMDFGIARLQGKESELKGTGTAVGTVSYLSPEQLRDEDVDHRADIFAFGVVAHELFAGHKPFRARSITELFRKVLHDEAPVLEADDLPIGLSDLVRRCLAKRPEDRPQSFGEILAELGGMEARVEPRSHAEQGAPPLLPDVADTVREALRTGELAAAEFSLHHARRRMGDSGEFRRRFGALQEELEERRTGAETPTPAEPPARPRPQPAEIAQRIAHREFATAERMLIAASEGEVTDPEIEELWHRLREARTARAGELPLHGTETASSPESWWGVPGNRLLVLGLGAALLLALLLIWLAVDDRGDDAPETSTRQVSPGEVAPR